MGNFIIFILVLFFLAAILRIDFFFTILYLFVGVYIVSHIWSRRVLKQLKIQRKLEQRVFQGETVTVSLTLENPGLLPIPWLLLNDTFSTVLSSPPFFRQVITLDNRSSQSLHYTLTARRRGYYPIGPLTLETGDLLGINRRVVGTYKADSLIVYPKILPITRLKLPTHSPQVVLPTTVPLFRDPTRIIGVQNYVWGDNPRHIHWPASAATGEIVVKQFQTAIARDNAIFLNMNRVDYGRPGQADVAIELAIVAAASLAHHIVVLEELPVGLITTALDPIIKDRQRFQLRPAKGRGHLMQILEVLARIDICEESDFLSNLRQEVIHLSWGSTVIIISSIESEALLETILFLKRSGLRVTLVLAQPEAYGYVQPKQATTLGIPTFYIKKEKDIEAWSLAP